MSVLDAKKVLLPVGVPPVADVCTCPHDEVFMNANTKTIMNISDMNMSKAKLCSPSPLWLEWWLPWSSNILLRSDWGKKPGRLRDQMARLQTENERLVSHAAQAVRVPSLSSERLRELLRLRGEVGVLRRQQRELQQAIAAAQSRGASATSQPAFSEAPQPNSPAPFQVQLVADEAGGNTEPLTNGVRGGAGEILHVQKTPLLDYAAISSATIRLAARAGNNRLTSSSVM